MRILKLTLAYDGSRFVGWQRQVEGSSIQGLLEDALARLEGASVTVHGAGRTDAGVHALGQVASVRLECAHQPAVVMRALNAQLPPDVRVLSAEARPDDFHARFSARSKRYRYRIDHGAVADPFERAYAWHVPGPLDVASMRDAAAVLVGSHDFAAFQSAGSGIRDTVRVITRSDLAAGRMLVYEIHGNGFLRHMVRAIVGTLVEVGRGRRSPGDVAALLAGGRRADAGRTAPPQGLFIVGVDYD